MLFLAKSQQPPAKAGGLWLRLKPDRSAIRPIIALSDNREVVVRLGGLLIFDVLLPSFICHVSATHNPVTPSPKVLAPVTLLQVPELREQSMRTLSLQELNSPRYRQIRRYRDQHMDMVTIN